MQVVALSFRLLFKLSLFQITAIVFVYSKTTYLPLNMFKHFPNLQRIVVSNPYTFMSALKNGHFLQADALTEVVITNQRLQDLGARVFEGAKKIVTIKLDNDMIENVDEDAFSQLATLEVISMNHNLIKALPMKTFSTVKNLRTLDLSANMISWLQGGIFDANRFLMKVNFARNWFLLIDQVNMAEETYFDFTNSFCVDNYYQRTTKLNAFVKTNCDISIDILEMFRAYKEQDEINQVCSDKNTLEKVGTQLEQTRAKKAELIKKKGDLEEEIFKVKIYRNSLC